MNLLLKGNEFTVFIGFVLQGIGFPLPLPLLFGLLDYLVAKGQISTLAAVGYAAGGSFLGNITGYYIGYTGGSLLFNSKSRWLVHATKQISKRGPGVMLVLRWLGGYAQGAWVLGASRTPLLVFMFYIGIADISWAVFWVTVGEALIKKMF
ncbi:MAG: hypothetical protein PWQ82_747 [Thermosediminibacterales bacterium]|nr:hypothetical protein [Thermosediminibacterales bacterium]MDK2836132.1 hypothetical protein [Thermosediminibacterales bacterium]